jgi:CBS domain containing-hemolysin-like protein
MVIMDMHAPFSDNLKIAAETRYSRYPVFDSQKQEIVGLIHIKDIFDALYQQKQVVNFQPFLRPILKISPRMSVLTLLRKFREGAPHFALIYKNQDLMGFVTLDDLLHILIGHINDEFHKTHDDWEKTPEGNFIVRGDCPIYSLERALDCDIDLLDIEPEPETLAGLIVNHLGRMPTPNEAVEFKEFTAVIKKIRGSRILNVMIIPK